MTVNNPSCSCCGHVFAWRNALGQLAGRRRHRIALWGVVCPICGEQLKVPNSRVLLILASGVFFGSQTSTLLLLKDLTVTEFWLAKLWLIVGFYAIAVFVFLKLERVE